MADERAVYAQLERTSARLAAAIAAAADAAGVPCRVQRVGSMLGFFLTRDEVWSLADVDASDRAAFARLFHALLRERVYLPPSAYETLFVSAAFGSTEVEHAAEAFRRAFASL
jgi:glutamate-1-semialdehyde 2,1-aminomutase